VVGDREVAADQLLSQLLPVRVVDRTLGVAALQRYQMLVFVVFGLS
jgi:hypothetical protein